MEGNRYSISYNASPTDRAGDNINKINKGFPLEYTTELNSTIDTQASGPGDPCTNKQHTFLV